MRKAIVEVVVVDIAAATVVRACIVQVMAGRSIARCIISIAQLSILYPGINLDPNTPSDA